MAQHEQIDTSGDVYGRLTMIERGPNDGRKTCWHCRCECGTEIVVRAASLRSGNTRSCGCLHRERSAERCSEIGKTARTHGHATSNVRGKKASRTYKSWDAMKQRCLNPNASNYHLYGERGITICEAWFDSFETFFADMGERPEGMSIDRIDPDGNYEPGNCRWATPQEQTDNRRVTC